MASDATLDTPTIVLAIDGLRAHAIGAYGQTAHETPAFDTFAADSETYEWCFAPTPEPADVYRRLSATLPAPSLLVTDEPTTTTPFEERGVETVHLVFDEPAEAAASIATTDQAKRWERFAEELVRFSETLPDDASPVVWFHTRGLYGAWDAPIELVDAQRDEDDPAIEPSVESPDTRFEERDSTEACDARFAGSCRYAAQITVLDACLGGALDVIDAAFEGRSVRVVVVGMSGFPLGEHGRVGGRDDRLYSEQHHVAALVCDGSSRARFARNRSIISLDQMLRQVITGRPAPADAIRLSSRSGNEVIRTKEWFLLRPAACDPSETPHSNDTAIELYAKPDDRWEQNDVASLDEAACDDLLAAIAGLRAGESAIGPPGASK